MPQLRQRAIGSKGLGCGAQAEQEQGEASMQETARTTVRLAKPEGRHNGDQRGHWG